MMRGMLTWLPQADHRQLTASPEHISWLLEQGSITQRLRQSYPCLTVEICQEGLDVPLPDEALKLGIGKNSPVWVRSVLLQQQARPLIRARTVIPDGSDTNPWHRVQRLGQQPLGELLFQLTDLERSDFEFTLTNGEFQNVQASDATARLARRRVFHRRGAPLLLTEVFMDCR